jgi:Membrane-associated lipoprotein involved in thiamine biosynthesis
MLRKSKISFATERSKKRYHQCSRRSDCMGLSTQRKALDDRYCRSQYNKTSFSFLEITNTSIATSGNYEKFVLIDGKKYSHTIDPKTGLPVRGIKSVTIICPNAEIADAMATPVMIMGIKTGLDMLNQMKGVAGIIIDDNDKIYTTKNINLT